jgi:hypothetical protein
MSIISLPSNKDIEHTSLETHVVLSTQRYKSIEERVNKLEADSDNLKSQVRSNKHYVLGATATILAGILSTIVALIIRFPGG